jgi:hypothetical protein
LWYQSGHLHEECLEKGKETATLAGRNPIRPTICGHTEDKKSQRTPKITTGRVFSSNYSTLGLSFAAALQNNMEQQQLPQPRQVQWQVQPQWNDRGFQLLCSTISSRKQVSQFGLLK